MAGEPVWVAFHSRDAAWDAASSGNVTVETAGGDALSGAFAVAQTDAPITFVALSPNLTELYIHVRNEGASPVTLDRLLVDGRDVLGADVACVSDPVLAPKSAAMYTVPLCTAAELGSAWTVVADWSGTADAVAVGRHLRPSFPIETWPAGGDCTKPGGNDAFLVAVRPGAGQVEGRAPQPRRGARAGLRGHGRGRQGAHVL